MLGLLAHGGLALGLVILSFFPAMRLDLHALLFGDILAVSRTDLAVIWGGGAIVLGVLWWLWRPLLAATVDADLATVAGLKPERARLIFGLLVAVVIAVAIKIVGILLIVALLVIPAATVRRFAPSPNGWPPARRRRAPSRPWVGSMPPRPGTRRRAHPSSWPRWRSSS